MMHSLNVWVQHANLSTPIDTHVQTAEQVMTVFKAEDWAGQLKEIDRLMKAGENACPPGMGVVRFDGAILHICPQSESKANIHWHSQAKKKVLGIFNRSLPPYFVESVDLKNFEIALRKFISGDDANVAKILKVAHP